MEIKRCMNCMEELSEDNGICPACGTDNGSIEQPNYALRCGAMLHGRYLVGKVLGQGGFGITYIGLDMLLNIKVAVKEYFPMGMVTRDSGGSSKILWNASQASQSQRQSGYNSFLKEARKMAKIDQIPSIVRVRDLFLENETAYIVMDFVEGITLKQKLSQEGPMAFSECLALLRPMLEDLAKVHKQGMIHRDISPDNIMIQTDGSVCLLDLGAAKDMTTAHGVSSQVVAKKGFSPFEQYVDGGKVGSWTDVYALCSTIYYCITGRLLPGALERLDSNGVDFPDGMKEPLSEEKKEALRAGLEVRMEQRTQSIEELMRQLDTGNPEGEERHESLNAEEESRNPEEVSVSKPEKGESQKSESIPNSEHKEERQSFAILRKLNKVKKGVWAVLAACLVVVAVFIYTLSGSKPEEPSEPMAKIEEGNEIHESQKKDMGTKKDINEDRTSGGNEKQNEEIEPKEEQKNPSVMMDVMVLGNKYIRDDFCKITFADTLKGKAEDAWNVSANHDESVMAWVSPAENGMYELFIGAEGEIQAPESCESLFENFVNVEEINFNGCFDTSQVTDMGNMFYQCNSLKQLDLSGFDTSKVTNMGEMFNGCINLEQLDISSFDTSQVTDMRRMFCDCEKLSQLDLGNFDTSQVTSMSKMFYQCRSISQLDLSNFDTSQVTSMSDMFGICGSLCQLDLSSFDTSQVTTMESMFYSCGSLEQLILTNFNTSQVTNMWATFHGCSGLKQLDVSSFDTSRVTKMSYMFRRCINLEQLDVSNFDTSQVTDMREMFSYCQSLEQLDLSNFNTSQVTSTVEMFSYCTNLKQLDLSSFDMSNVGEWDYHMFLECNAEVTGLN